MYTHKRKRAGKRKVENTTELERETRRKIKMEKGRNNESETKRNRRSGESYSF